jgi:hypothetical protein
LREKGETAIRPVLPIGGDIAARGEAMNGPIDGLMDGHMEGTASSNVEARTKALAGSERPASGTPAWEVESGSGVEAAPGDGLLLTFSLSFGSLYSYVLLLTSLAVLKVKSRLDENLKVCQGPGTLSGRP